MVLPTSTSRNRVTAGLPGVSPDFRHRQDRELTQRDLDRQALIVDRANKEITVANDGEFPTTDPRAQKARILLTGEVENKLKALNPNLHFEFSIQDPNKKGVYIIENRDGESVKRFICGMEGFVQPEFSIREECMERMPDPNQLGQMIDVVVFTREIRGWRTVLARLLREKLVTEPQVERAFNISGGRSSANWQAITT